MAIPQQPFFVSLGAVVSMALLVGVPGTSAFGFQPMMNTGPFSHPSSPFGMLHPMGFDIFRQPLHQPMMMPHMQLGLRHPTHQSLPFGWPVHQAHPKRQLEQPRPCGHTYSRKETQTEDLLPKQQIPVHNELNSDGHAQQSASMTPQSHSDTQLEPEQHQADLTPQDQASPTNTAPDSEPANKTPTPEDELEAEVLRELLEEAGEHVPGLRPEWSSAETQGKGRVDMVRARVRTRPAFHTVANSDQEREDAPAK